ncbi:MAG: SEL1-like repeat protein [Candidatus Paracaedibacteraceae bacterium]|nr:SEL1-like repeat protein [Candidatus Paracaedibacteraceae bacterium]
MKWFRVAAKQGCAVAEYNYGLALAEGEGIEKNLYKAFKYIRKSAEQGYPWTQKFLKENFLRILPSLNSKPILSPEAINQIKK